MRTVLSRQWLLSLAGLLLLAPPAAADVKLPGFFGNNQVLQRDLPVPIWGWAKPGETVTVTFAGQTKTATADAEGKWLVKLDPLPANDQPAVLTVAAANKLECKNVVVGDVWVCSGQSNMEMTVGGTLDAAKFIAAANYPAIRQLRVPKNNQTKPQADVKAGWDVCAPGTVGGFTAAGYYFALEIHREMKVPVGLIYTNWGGTCIETWICPQGYAAIPELKSLNEKVQSWDATTAPGQVAWRKGVADLKAWLPTAEAALSASQPVPDLPKLPMPDDSQQAPTKLYNGMIHPLLPYAIKGALWYQGEANGGEGDSYFRKMQALIQGWRQVWGQGDFPFYFVQLANYQAAVDTPGAGNGWAKLREAQTKSLSIPNTGMAVIVDIGEARDIHPRNKQDVGKRLAQWALKQTYGREVIPSGPIYKSHKVEGDQIRISFDYAGAGLIVGEKNGLEPTKEVAGGQVKRLAIAGADKKFVWAQAKIEGGELIVSSPQVKEPIAVRYAFSQNPEGCNLYNKEGLPASPFRTDNW